MSELRGIWTGERAQHRVGVLRFRLGMPRFATPTAAPFGDATPACSLTRLAGLHVTQRQPHRNG